MLGLGLGLPYGGVLKAPSFFDEFGVPSIGYSTMLLGNSTNQTETRRSSDDATQNDTAAQIQNRLLSWVNTDLNLYTSDFSAGVDGMSDTNGTASAPITFGGKDDVLEFEADGTFAAHGVAKNAILNADGGSVRFEGEIYIPSTNSNIDGARIWSGTFGDGVQVISTLDEWVTFDFTINNDGGANFVVWGLDGTDFQFSASGDKFYLKNIVVTQETADGLIRTFYNIGSEASADLQNTTASEQPEIVSDGVLQTIGSDPAINFTSGFRFVGNSGGFSFMGFAQTFSIDIDFEVSDVTTRQAIFTNRNNSNDRFGLIIFGGNLYIEGFNGGYTGANYSISINTRYKMTIIWSAGTVTVYSNGALIASAGASVGFLGSVTSNETTLGNDRSVSTANPYLGSLCSILVYNEAKDLAHNVGFTNAY